MEDFPSRYGTAAGWEGNDPYKKLREKARRAIEDEPNLFDNMLVQPEEAQWAAEQVEIAPTIELFGSFWLKGEVAVLFGERGSGKSLLAVQIAESIARGRPLISYTGEGTSPQNVLYIDFQLSNERFIERYLCPSPDPDGQPQKHEFGFRRIYLEWDGDVPKAFRGSIDAFMRHSIRSIVEAEKTDVLIIDDISGLSSTFTGNVSATRMLKTLRHWTADGLSILIVAGARPRKRPREIRADDVLGSRMITELADSVLAIGRSTAGADLRYLKHIASRAPDTLVDTGQVVNLLLGYPEPPARDFLSFDICGLLPETVHLRDHEKEALENEREQRRALERISRRTPKEILVNAILDGSYQRFLKGR